MNYGDRLKQLRLSKDLKQSDLAAILGVSTSAIGSYERCERQPAFELLHKYSKYFNVSIDYMLCNSNELFTVEYYQQSAAFELSDLLYKHSITLEGAEITGTDKRRILDIATVLLFDKLT